MNLEKIEGRFRPTADGKCAVSRKGMVSTAFPEATRAGVEMLERGGNAVDAACAAAFALGVCEPQASGIGGQSMALLHIGGKTLALDGSSRVPSLAHRDRLGKDETFTGYRATTVPSTPAVLGYLHFRYGRLDWKTILRPAIGIARNGYRMTGLQSSLQERERESFLSVNPGTGARYFLKEGSVPYNAGDLFVQSDLADLLEHLSLYGPRSFYQGDIARRIHRDMEENGGFLRGDDLALIPWPVERRPLKRKYRDVAVFTVPPPGAGRTLLLVLLMLNHLPSKILRNYQPETFHFMAEIFRKALLNHRERPFDPNTYRQMPEDNRVLSREYARSLSASIRDRIDPQLPLADPYVEGGETTHLSVMDEAENAVAITQSIERVYGSKAAAEGLGFLYNNYMSALEWKDPSHPYYLRPNAVPWSSVAPVIVFHRSRPWLVAGSPGSDRIFSSVSQFLSHVIDGNLPLGEAMLRPRFHCSIGGTIYLESERFDPAILEYLESSGYKLVFKEPFSFYLGAIHAVMKTQTRGDFQGVAEFRRDGIAAGPQP